MRRPAVRRQSICVAVTAFALGAAADARAQSESERIASFRADVTVKVDGSMQVEETIRVHGEGRKIDHGIYRDFPTHVRGLFNRYLPFDVLDVRRDGQPEPYTVTPNGEAAHVQIGDANVHLGPGDFTYVITYRTDNQLHFLADHDELYWNVTGNDWQFPIDEASAAVQLPDGAGDGNHIGAVEGYTGPSGSKARDLRTERHGDAEVFTTTRPLARREGLTIVLGWPKGFVRAPAAEALRAAFWRDNGTLVAGAACALLLLVFFVVAWRRVGRDPPPGPIVAVADPPAGLSPAALRYVVRMGADDTTFAAALISLADKSHVSITRGDDDVYTLKWSGKDAALLPAEERAVVDKLFAEGDTLRLSGANARPLLVARVAMRKALAAACRGRYFTRNGRVALSGVLASLVVLVMLACSVRPEARGASGLFTAWVAAWTVVVAVLAKAVIDVWRKTPTGGRRGGTIGGALFLTLFAGAFALGDVVSLVAYGFSTSGLAAVSLAAVVVADVLFVWLLPAPTAEGRRVLDAAAGYGAFLGGPAPTGSEAAHASALGYAVALGVVDAWTRGLVATTPADRLPPLWNDPSWSGTSYGDFAGSFTAAVSSAGTSGAGGGGSSGGGGGGGGGGGW